MSRFRLLLVPLLLAPITVFAQTRYGSDVSSMEMEGTIGPYRVGLNYTVRNDTQLIAAHYFYASQLRNIPLTGTTHGETVEWKGSDGSAFHLHFVGNGSNGNEPLTFYNSVGLRGTWVLGSRTLPVDLRGGWSTPNPGERFYGYVTTKSDASFESMVEAAQKAILSANPALTAKYVHFPLSVNFEHSHLLLHNPAELRANWNRVFPSRFVKRLREDIPHEMFGHEGETSLGLGDLWFDDKGITAVNVE